MTFGELTEEIEIELKLMETVVQDVHHGYGFQTDWNRMIIEIEKIQDIFDRFKTKVSDNWEKL